MKTAVVTILIAVNTDWDRYRGRRVINCCGLAPCKPSQFHAA
jgi:hypothetical protein